MTIPNNRKVSAELYEGLDGSIGSKAVPNRGTLMIGFGCDRLNTHFTHESLHAFTIDGIPFIAEVDHHVTDTIKRMPGIFLINQVHPHEIKILFNTLGLM